MIGHNESLSSPYHREDVVSLRTQTHSDFDHADVRVYRGELGALAAARRRIDRAVRAPARVPVRGLQRARHRRAAGGDDRRRRLAERLGGRPPARQEEVRDYWTRQWGEIDPRVEPVSFARRPNGGVAVDVQQVVRTHDGALVNESVVVHVYGFRGGLVAHMEIEEPGSGRLE